MSRNGRSFSCFSYFPKSNGVILHEAADNYSTPDVVSNHAASYCNFGDDFNL
jgi:hypothetical protein